MSGGSQKRNSSRGIAPAAPSSMEVDHGQGRLGARRERSLATPAGGGYPDTCTILKVRDSTPGLGDPRLDELNRMGMPRVWLDIAIAIGVDNFLTIWRRLDREPSFSGGDGFRIEVVMRRYSSYLRFQRNLYIETLIETGQNPKAVQRAVRERLGEKVGIRHIYRLTRGK